MSDKCARCGEQNYCVACFEKALREGKPERPRAIAVEFTSTTPLRLEYVGEEQRDQKPLENVL